MVVTSCNYIIEEHLKYFEFGKMHAVKYATDLDMKNKIYVCISINS